MRQSSGFTLIELMIVVAIMGVMATMAVPLFQERVVKAQVAEAIGLSEFAKEAVSAYYKQNKRMPHDNAEAGLPPPDKIIGNFVVRLEVAQGAIHVTLGNRINRNAAGQVLTVRAAGVPGYPAVPLAWNCGLANAPAAMKPFGENRTSLPPPFLPVDCRS